MRKNIIVAIIGVVALGTISAVAERGPTTSALPPLTLAEVHDRGIEGELGIRLGTIVPVSGEVIANSSNAKVDVNEPFFLRIDKVANERLTRVAIFHSSDMPLVRDIASLKVGDKFQCIGYETGGFVGSPSGEFNYVPAYATTDYSFHIRFIVLSVK